MEDTSAVFLLQHLLSDAHQQECTDIHIVSSEDTLSIQFRVQGKLLPYLTSKRNPRALLRRIKALARMDIAEHRVPQNGSFQTLIDAETVSVRVATLPIATGESAVLRLLPTGKLNVTLEQLGMSSDQVDAVTGILQGAPGLVLVAGPTGAGKTTTMYAMLRELAETGKAVVSIEDPVEIPSTLFTQLEVREERGISFATGLKSLLRQDPDVIMVGEIRDAETAKVVLQAALTGHFVISTTHARDLVGAFARLTEFGIPRTMLAEVFRAVIVQHAGDVGRSVFEYSSVRQYSVRFDVFPVTDEIYDLLLTDLPWASVRQQFTKQQSTISLVSGH